MIVDDNPPIQANLKYLLEAAGDIQVTGIAANGVEALAQARKKCPDVAVVDISMPLMDGIETTQHLQDLCQLTRVTILSTYDQPEYVRHAVQAGAVGYVLKDNIVEDLLAAVRTLYQGGYYFCKKIAGIAQDYLDQRAAGP